MAAWAWILKNPAWTICIVLALSCASLFGLERYRAARLDAARAELKTVQANFGVALDSNKNLTRSLDSLKAAHDALIQTVKANTEAIERAATDVQIASATIKANSGRVREVREEIKRDPSCADLASIDIARQCPALADSLRREARRTGYSDGGGEGAGQGPSRPTTH